MQISISKHSWFQSSSHTIIIHRGQVWNEFLFWHLDWQLNKWEIIYCERCSRLLLAEMLPVSEACVFPCVSSNGLKSRFNVKSDASKPQSRFVSLKETLHHFQWKKSLHGYSFFDMFMLRDRPRLDFEASATPVSGTHTLRKNKHIISLGFPVKFKRNLEILYLTWVCKNILHSEWQIKTNLSSSGRLYAVRLTFAKQQKQIKTIWNA